MGSERQKKERQSALVNLLFKKMHYFLNRLTLTTNAVHKELSTSMTTGGNDVDALDLKKYSVADAPKRFARWHIRDNLFEYLSYCPNPGLTR